MLTTPHTLSIVDVVHGTSSNADGDKLFATVASFVRAGQIVRLSLKGVTPMSTSFLNSSFGELIDEFGLDAVRSQVKLVEYVPSQAMRIKEYIDTFSLAQAS